MTKNTTIQFGKTNMCTGKLRCRAENQDQQKECKYFADPDCSWAKGDCFFFSSSRCYSQEARSEALDRLINSIKEQL